MDRKIFGIGTGAILVVSLIAILGFVFAQNSEKGTGLVDADNDGVCDNAEDCPYKDRVGSFVDADGDGVCDNAANCQMHKNKFGCHGTEGCPAHTEGFKGGCPGHTVTE